MPVSITRTRRNDQRSQGYFRWSVQQNGVTSYGATATDLVGRFKEIQDNPHRNFHKRKASGEIILSDLYVVESNRSVSDGTLQQGPYSYDSAVGPKGSVTKYYGDWCFKAEGVTGEVRLPVYVAQDIARLREIVLVKAHARLDDAQVLGGEALSSAGATIKMLRRPLGGAQDLLRTMYKHRGKRIRKSGSNVKQATADTWLEYRYGWTPLILDSFAIAEMFQAKLGQECNEWRVSRAGGNISFQVRGDFTDRLVDSAFKLSGNRSINRNVTANAGVLYRLIPRTNPNQLAAMFGLNARNIPATLWETVPYSFVVDWFSNVGQWLSAVTPNPDVTIGGNWVTTTDKTSETMIISQVTRSLNLPPVTLITGTGGQSLRETTAIIRYCNGSLPATPVWTGTNLSLQHAADAVALLLTPVSKSLAKFING